MLNNTNDLVSIILSILLIVSILIGIVAWFIRLESEVKRVKEKVTENEIDKVSDADKQLQREQEIWKKLESFQMTLNEILKSMGKLEGKLEAYVNR